MTEEILQAAILQLRSKATEHYGIIKDLYQRPARPETVEKICQSALLLAQFEGAMLTLQNYAPSLSVPVEETAPPEPQIANSATVKMTQEELLKRSPTARKAAKARKKSDKTKEASE